jgi:hypothetical protein
MSTQPTVTVREYLAMNRGQSSITPQMVNGMLEALESDTPDFIPEASTSLFPLGNSGDEYFQAKYRGKIEHPAYTDTDGERHRAWTEYVLS